MPIPLRQPRFRWRGELYPGLSIPPCAPGRSNQLVVAWFNIPEVGWVPFLDEGLMMTNVRRKP
jgi:hypothetical protein